MGMYNEMGKTFKEEYKGKDTYFKSAYKQRLIGYRKENHGVVRVARPTNIKRARELGYKAKQGIIVVRSRIRRGSLRKGLPTRGRKPKKMGISKITAGKPLQRIAEERAARKYSGMEVLNSYFVGEDGNHKYFEVILVDPANQSIQSDKDLGWICSQKHSGRVFRGKTSAGKKSRGLNKKGFGTEKIRPGVNANLGRGK
ncbi:MAG: 50S ribosomal protein L15e [Candidatus Diapherotrites archaeon]|nr:50S ribosomal protein L15e [Candidatus Diapherotrites archaeon]